MSSNEIDCDRDKAYEISCLLTLIGVIIFFPNAKLEQKVNNQQVNIYRITSRPFRHILSCKLGKQFNITQLRLTDIWLAS